MLFQKSKANDWMDLVVTNAMFVTLTVLVSEASRIGRTDLERVDNMKHLAGFFGLGIPYTMTVTQLKNMTYCIPALKEAALQIQNILRFSIYAKDCYKDFKHITLPNKWDERTVCAAHSLLEQNAKKFHLDRNDMPKPRYSCVNNMDLAVLRTIARNKGVNYLVFFPNMDSLASTSIPKRAQLPKDPMGFFGKNIPCVKIDDKINLSLHLSQQNIIAAI